MNESSHTQGVQLCVLSSVHSTYWPSRRILGYGTRFTPWHCGIFQPACPNLYYVGRITTTASHPRSATRQVGEVLEMILYDLLISRVDTSLLVFLAFHNRQVEFISCPIIPIECQLTETRTRI